MTKTKLNGSNLKRYYPNFTPARRRLLVLRLKTVPFPRYLGMKLKSIEPGRAVLTLRVTTKLKQYQGILHGGVMVSLADTAATIAALTIIPEKLDLVTVEMNGNFLASVDRGLVTADAEVLHLGARTSIIECSIFDRVQRRLWKGMFTFLNFPSEMNISH